jgi:SAM-dependent methyltransferase
VRTGDLWDEDTARFYDGLADTYHALYPDWRSQVAEQAAALDRLIGASHRPATCVADVACGIGTQLVGLARLGYRTMGSDLSAKAVERARHECRSAEVRSALAVADMRRLPWPDASADAVVCADNAVPHLLRDEEVVDALREMARVLRPGGTVIVTTRDYDRVLPQRPGSTPLQLFDSGGERIVSYQLWHWRDHSDVYDLEHFQVRKTGPDEWTTQVRTAAYRAYTRHALAALATRAGLSEPEWHAPADTGFFQPLMTAHT